MNSSAALTGEKAKPLLSAAKVNFSIASGPKGASTAAARAILHRRLTSAGSVERRAAGTVLFDMALKLSEQGRSAEAVEVYDTLLSQFATESEAVFQEMIVAALFNRGNMLGELGKRNDALLAYETVVSRFGASDTPLIAEKVARALYNSAKILERNPAHIKEAIDTYEHIRKRFQTLPHIYPLEIVAQALVNMGVLLGISEAAIRAYDEIIVHFGDSSQEGLRNQLKKALLNKGRVLMTTGRAAEALGAFDAVLAHSGTSQDGSILWAMFWKMTVLSSLGREQEVVELCDKLVESIAPTTELPLKEAGASVLLTKASILKAGGDRIGEVASYDRLLSKFGLDSDRELVVLVIAAQERKVEALTSLGRNVEALLACDDIMARCNCRGGLPCASEHAAWALSAKAFIFAREDRSEDAAKVCSEIVRGFGPGSPTPLLECAGRALVERAGHFCDLGRYEEALSDCDTFLAAYQSSAEPWISEAVALALLIKGLSLLQIERSTEAAEVLNQIFTCFGGETEPPISDYVASARDLVRDSTESEMTDEGKH
jgi:tetratricopeptide (TPR) repeat protein